MPAAATATRTHGVLRRLAHLLGILLGWVGFVWLWWLVAQRPWEVRWLVWLIVGSLLLVPLLTAAWVWHNRSIHRRKGERRAVAPVEQRYDHDWHGRAVDADWAVLKRSRHVVVSVDGERKRYRGPGPAAAAQPSPTRS